MVCTGFPIIEKLHFINLMKAAANESKDASGGYVTSPSIENSGCGIHVDAGWIMKI